jgi:hypothetical protein
LEAIIRATVDPLEPLCGRILNTHISVVGDGSTTRRPIKLKVGMAFCADPPLSISVFVDEHRDWEVGVAHALRLALQVLLREFVRRNKMRNRRPFIKLRRAFA